MSIYPENNFIDIAFKILLQIDMRGNLKLDNFTYLDWDHFLEFTRKNVISVRTHNELKWAGIKLGEEFSNYVKEEVVRIDSTVKLIGGISRACHREGIECLFTKAFQHYPDMGHDIDLFVLERSRRIDGIIETKYNSLQGKNSLFNWISGKTSYQIKGCMSPVEIHHGRIGHIGEHNIYPQLLMRNKIRKTLEGFSIYIPSPEDQLILQAIQRIYGHLCIRISDIVHTIDILNNNNLNWDYIIKTIKSIGVFYGFSCYLTYVSQVVDGFLRNPLLGLELRKILINDSLGKIQFLNSNYRFPALSIIPAVYSKKLFKDFLSRNWEGAGRLIVLPPVAVISKLIHLFK